MTIFIPEVKKTRLFKEKKTHGKTSNILISVTSVHFFGVHKLIITMPTVVNLCVYGRRMLRHVNPYPVNLIGGGGDIASPLSICTYSKTCVKQPLRNRQNKDLNVKWKLNEGEKYCRAFCNTFDLH